MSQSIEESDLLRNRLRLELQEKQNLELKVTELTEKLVEAKKGLQETSLALHKVQMATNQLMTKRDQREIDLQVATEQNRTYERKISELESKILHMEGLSDAKQSVTQHSEKLLADKLLVIQGLEEENSSLRSQINTFKRDQIRASEEKQELEYTLEAKKKRITSLEEHIKGLETQQQQSMELIATNRDALFNSVVNSFDTAARLNTSPPRPGTRFSGGPNGRDGRESPSQLDQSLDGGNSTVLATQAAMPMQAPLQIPIQAPIQAHMQIPMQAPQSMYQSYVQPQMMPPFLQQAVMQQIPGTDQYTTTFVPVMPQQMPMQLMQAAPQVGGAQVGTQQSGAIATAQPTLDKAEIETINKKISEMKSMESTLSTLQTDKQTLENRLAQLEQLLMQQQSQQQQIQEQQQLAIQTLNQNLAASLQVPASRDNSAGITRPATSAIPPTAMGKFRYFVLLFCK